MFLFHVLCIFLLLSTSFAFGEDSIQQLMNADPEIRKEAAKQILKSKDLRYVPSLVEVAFFWTIKRDRTSVDEISDILKKLTGDSKSQKYFDWLQWIGRHPDVKPLPNYLALKRDVLSIIDPAFALFLNNENSIRIRPEEIVWGGVRKDGIPALINPPHISANQATYLRDSDDVFGILLGGEPRAYPLRIMDWHEMVNDVIGEIPVTIPYCTLCGSAIAYNPKVNGTTYTFGSSGLLYRSNKLMYDHNTQSLWSALSGEPVAGKLVDHKLKLEVLPIVRTNWSRWKRMHPQTTVMDIKTGHDRDYNKEPYKEYFESSKTMFPVPQEDSRLSPKDFVFAIRFGKTKKAYPLDLLIAQKFVSDKVEDANIVLVSEPDTKAIRAFRCDSVQADSSWTANEDFLVSSNGTMKCPRLGGHLAYWFGWFAQFPETELYSPRRHEGHKD